MSDGFFRSKAGYTTVQNEMVRDTNVSLRAKGLYLLIQSYITMPDRKFSKKFFLSMTIEGEKAFETAWVELKQKGYLKVHCKPNGNKFISEYELLDVASPGPHTFYYNKDNELTMTNIEREANRNGGEKQGDLAYPQKGGNAKIEENLRTPHLGTNANSGDNINLKIISEKKNNISTYASLRTISIDDSLGHKDVPSDREEDPGG